MQRFNGNVNEYKVIRFSNELKEYLSFAFVFVREGIKFHTCPSWPLSVKYACPWVGEKSVRTAVTVFRHPACAVPELPRRQTLPATRLNVLHGTVFLGPSSVFVLWRRIYCKLIVQMTKWAYLIKRNYMWSPWFFCGYLFGVIWRTESMINIRNQHLSTNNPAVPYLFSSRHFLLKVIHWW